MPFAGVCSHGAICRSLFSLCVCGAFWAVLATGLYVPRALGAPESVRGTAIHRRYADPARGAETGLRLYVPRALGAPASVRVPQAIDSLDNGSTHCREAQ